MLYVIVSKGKDSSNRVKYCLMLLLSKTIAYMLIKAAPSFDVKPLYRIVLRKTYIFS